VLVNETTLGHLPAEDLEPTLHAELSTTWTITDLQMIAKWANVVAPRTTWIEGFHASRIRGESPSVGLPEHRPARDGHSGIPKRGGGSMKEKKLTLSKETLRTLDEEELSLVVGAQNSGQFNPAKCPSSGHPNCK
jgi:hypothetical protein